MALFQKETCAHCGNETGTLERVKLADGKFLCWDCRNLCSEEFAENFLKKHTYEEYCEYLQHKEENRKKLEQFDPNVLVFNRIAIDLEKDWFVFYKKHPFSDREALLKANPEVFEAKDLAYYDTFTIVKEIKEGVFSDKVKADVELSIAFNNKWYPYAFKAKVLKNHKHKANVGVLSRKITFTENEVQENIELYLTSIMMENGINIPVDLGGKFTMNVDLEQYERFFTKMFELKKLGFFGSTELNDRLDSIAPNFIIKQKIKKRFGK